jgi:iron-sulfur cluster repair protein YtfE (RIC family)
MWLDYGTRCPNYVEGWWTPKEGGRPVLIKDCAPKRIFLMLQDIHNRLEGLQKAQEQQRNQSHNLYNSMATFVEGIVSFYDERLTIKLPKLSSKAGGHQRQESVSRPEEPRVLSAGDV